MRYLMNFSYDGSNFVGYQKQLKGRTVQNEIENVLKKITDEKIAIHASGRTDSKVHAKNQYAHFDTDKLNKDSLKKALNSLLPEDTYIKNIIEVEKNFHARFDVLKKEYIYLINMNEYNPFERNYVYQLNEKLDVKKMKEASLYLIGTHDFSTFSKKDEEKEDKIRTIYNIEFNEKENLEIKFIGNGFLRYMVRNLVGALIEVGKNKKEPIYIKEILQEKDRTKGSITAKAEGLYLNDVFY